MAEQTGSVTVKCEDCGNPTTNIGNRVCDSCEKKKGSKMNRQAYIFDLERTLSNDDHRRNLFPSDPKVHADYALYQNQFNHDPVIIGTASIAKSLQLLGFHIIISSGLPEQMRGTINSWLAMNGILPGKIFLRSIPEQIEMTECPVLKQFHLELIRDHLGFEVLAAFDDREDICAMYRENGIITLKVN